MKTTPIIEDYLQIIYSYAAEGKPIIGARLAKNLGVSAPTVTEVLHRLGRQGYIQLNEKKEIFLTPKGRELAEVMVRRHRLAERMLTDLLGLDWADVHEEAHRFEHAISPKIEERLKVLLGEPATCPHGSPIPGIGMAPAVLGAALEHVAPGATVVVERITEEAENDHAFLSFLGRHRIRPGSVLQVVEATPLTGTVTLAHEGEVLTLEDFAGRKILVRPVEHQASAVLD